jgi:hypothetical protein
MVRNIKYGHGDASSIRTHLSFASICGGLIVVLLLPFCA